MKTPRLCSLTFPENRVVYETMWKIIVEPERPQMTIRRMRFACWITTATHKLTHSELFHTYCCSTATMVSKRAPMLRYTYIASLVPYTRKETA
jgi:hypothetical protein